MLDAREIAASVQRTLNTSGHEVRCAYSNRDVAGRRWLGVAVETRDGRHAAWSWPENTVPSRDEHEARFEWCIREFLGERRQ